LEPPFALNARMRRLIQGRHGRAPSEESVMQINVKGHQVEVTTALRDYTASKFERVTRVFDQLHDISVVLGIEKLLHKAECTMQLSGKTLHADATAPDMYAAIDALIDKVDTQLRKHKEKLTDHHADAVRATRYS
jgi:putative sigma-54 modulation protein